MKIKDGYDRSKTPRMIDVRPMTLAEVQALPVGGHAEVITNDGKLRRVKITSVHLWKTRPNDVHVGVKYGMYEYAQFEAAEALQRFMVRLPEETAHDKHATAFRDSTQEKW